MVNTLSLTVVATNNLTASGDHLWCNLDRSQVSACSKRDHYLSHGQCLK